MYIRKHTCGGGGGGHACVCLCAEMLSQTEPFAKLKSSFKYSDARLTEYLLTVQSLQSVQIAG